MNNKKKKEEKKMDISQLRNLARKSLGISDADISKIISNAVAATDPQMLEELATTFGADAVKQAAIQAQELATVVEGKLKLFTIIAIVALVFIVLSFLANAAVVALVTTRPCRCDNCGEEFLVRQALFS